MWVVTSAATLQNALAGALDAHPGRQLQQEGRGLGPGIIILVVFGVLALVACAFSLGKDPATRLTVFCVASFCYMIPLVVLLTLPQESTPRTVDEVTDIGNFLRILFFVLMVCCSLCSLGALNAMHFSAKHKPPHVEDLEGPDLVRLAR